MDKKIIIAEIGSNHNGNLSLALKHIDEAKKSGADYVKFQMHISEEETTIDAPSPSYFKSESRYEYFKRINFNNSNWRKIISHCKKLNIGFLCSPFSKKAVDELEKLKVSMYKIPSGELTNHPLLIRLKKTKKFCILSTGMSNYKEIDNAVKILNKRLAILQCSSIYPCQNNNVGINVIKEMKNRYKKYNLHFGFSDHTLGYSASAAAASNGATIIEKHFTISKKLYGSDAKHSMEPDEFKLFTQIIKDIWKIMDKKVNKNDIKKYKKMKFIFEKGIVANQNLTKGHTLTEKDLAFKKPQNGIRADEFYSIIGKKLKKNIFKDEFFLKKYLK